MKLYIADDETDVREGIRYLLDWSALGVTICGEGKNGQETLEQILTKKPDLVLMDIRMPKLSGLEVIQKAIGQGFCGKFIILSGYSDFAYAQEAMRFGVTCYLTKPIDEDELERAVLDAKEALFAEREEHKKLLQYKDRAKDSILLDILQNKANYLLLDLNDLNLTASVYQVVLYTNYNQDSFQTVWDFAGILRLANHNNNSLDYVKAENQNIIILKGEFSIRRFEDMLSRHMEQPQKGSPLDSLFLTYGRRVYTVSDIHCSFEDANLLMNRRFFCGFNQHVLGPSELPGERTHSSPFVPAAENVYSQRISDYIQSGNRHMLLEVLNELKEELYRSGNTIAELKLFLADIMIQVKTMISRTYSGAQIPFANNAAIIQTIEEKYYLYEILQYFTIQFEMCMNAVGSPARESIMDGILEYIHHNYRENLKLSNLAELFGYNSSYLGKVFTRTTGKSFNSYVDEVRIERSKELLDSAEYKVYEIAALVGYTNVDYFHKKFKKYVGMSPAEYRKRAEENK